MISLYYLTPLAYPSHYANRLQVAKMGNAFSKKSTFCLFVVAVNDTTTDIFEAYDTDTFCVRQVGRGSLHPRSFFLALRYASVVRNAKQESVFYCRDILLAFWLCVLSGRFRKQFFLELHSVTRFSDWIQRYVVKRARGIITTNHAKARYVLEHYGVQKEKILVAPNGVDLSEFAGKTRKEKTFFEKHTIPIAKPIVLYVGTLKEEYGIELLKEAAATLNDIATIVAVGGDPSQHTLANIEHVGQVAHREALYAMLQADILVAPYTAGTMRNQLYRSPIKVREYMASGVPMVVPRLSAITEIVTDDEAYIYEPDNRDDFVAKIRYALSHREESKQKARKAYKKATACTWSNRAQRTISFIEAHI